MANSMVYVLEFRLVDKQMVVSVLIVKRREKRRKKMRTKEMIDNLESHISARLEWIEDALGKIVARGEIVDILQTELGLMRGERKELLNRLMARDFETLQTFSIGGEPETIGEDIKDEENPDMAGEIFDAPKTTI